MDLSDYRFAQLNPDEIEELRKAERTLSAKTGEPITIIAFSGQDPLSAAGASLNEETP